MTQPNQNPPPANPQSPLDKLDDLGITFADGLPPGPLTDAEKKRAQQALDAGFSEEEAALFLRPQPVTAAVNVDSTTGEEHTGAMIALIPSSNDKLRLALPDGEPADQLHTTLVFLGEVAMISPDAQQSLLDWARTYAQGRSAVCGNGFAISLFNPAGDEPCWVLEVSEEDQILTPLMETQEDALNAAMSILGPGVPPQHAPWRPHITLIYDGSTDWAFELVDSVGPVVYDTLRIALGGQSTDFPLTTPSLGDDASLYSTATEHGGVVMPYHAARRAECPDSKPWAVVKDSDGSILACHASRHDAESQIAAINAHEQSGGTVTFVAGHAVFSQLAGKPIPVPTESPATSGGSTALGTDVNDVATEFVPNLMGTWEGVLALEGEPTGDGRQFAVGALTWADLPIPLLWQKQVIGEGHMGQVTAGSITQIWRDGNKIMGSGTFDLNGTDGAEAYRQVREGFLKGLSIDPDSITDSDVEYVYPEGDGGGTGDEMLDLFGPAPELTVFHAGRIRATTLVQIPAFVEAQLWLTDGQQVMASPAPSGGMDETHYALFTDGTWDGPANQARLARVITPEIAARAYAYVSPQRNEFGQVARGANLFLHHEIDSTGNPGAANLTAVASAIAAVNSATHLDHATRYSAYEHLARHVRAAGLVPLPFVPSSTLVAASHTIVVNDLPPAEWFEEPTDVPSYGALTITDEGRVYGYLAPAKVPHRSFSNRNVFVPTGVDYARFMGRETLVAGGGRVTTGCITMNCGHASTDAHVTGDRALEHYDNSCSIVASVRVGENQNGTWVAGALLPDVSADQVTRMMACQLSGDWRPLARGKYELAGALLVPVPGFPMARTRPSVRVNEDGQLVASAVPVRFVRGEEHRENALHVVAQRVARSIGRDTRSRAEALRARVHGR